MNGALSTLEQRLDDALHERADAMPAGTERLPVPIAEPMRASRRPLAWTVAAAAVVLAVATLMIARPFAADSGPATPTPSTEPTTTTLPLPSPTSDAGPEVPLTRADTDDTRFLVRMRLRDNPTAPPIAVVSAGLAPIIVTGNCITIAAAPVLQAGYQGSCVPDPARTLIGTVDTSDKDAPGSRAYGAWIDVPAGTAYVTYTYGDQRWWQRPIDGITYSATEARPQLGGEPFVVRAFEASGRQLAEVSRTPIKDATGAWDWF